MSVDPNQEQDEDVRDTDNSDNSDPGDSDSVSQQDVESETPSWAKTILQTLDKLGEKMAASPASQSSENRPKVELETVDETGPDETDLEYQNPPTQDPSAPHELPIQNRRRIRLF